MNARCIDNKIHTLSLDLLDEEFEFPTFEKRTKVPRDKEVVTKVKTNHFSFKRFLAEQQEV
jgi:hypothetical protein